MTAGGRLNKETLGHVVDQGAGLPRGRCASADHLPEGLGGSAERARAHFKRAVELQGGSSPGPYVALALGIAVPAQDRAEFESLLKKALEVDPEKDPSTRLVTLVQQRRARALLDQIETRFAK